MKHLKTLLKAVCLVACLSITNNGKAQICSCPYTIVNNLQCDITVGYEVVDANCHPLCAASNVVISPGVFTLPCCSLSGFDVYVSVYTPFSVALSVNGVSSPNCNFGVMNLTQNHPMIAGCSTGPIQVLWTCSSVIVQ
jgi:hypothetical protein